MKKLSKEYGILAGSDGSEAVIPNNPPPITFLYKKHPNFINHNESELLPKLPPKPSPKP